MSTKYSGPNPGVGDVDPTTVKELPPAESGRICTRPTGFATGWQNQLVDEPPPCLHCLVPPDDPAFFSLAVLNRPLQD